jgi:O-antigen biosynthesis protein
MTISALLKKFAFSFFPPESPGERFLRTQYHRLAANQFYVAWQIKDSKASYPKWLKLQQTKPFPETQSFLPHPTVSFLLPVDTSTVDAAIKTIKSIQGQRLDGWQVVLTVSGEQAERSKLAEIFGLDPKITIMSEPEMGISQSIEFAMGQFIVCCLPGDEFLSTLLDYFYVAYVSFPDAKAYYYDCDEREVSSVAPVPFFKPSQLSPELLLSVNYLSNAIIDKKAAENVANLIDSRLNISHQERELLFLLAERNAKMQHIPQVMVHKVKSQDDDQQTEQVIHSHLARIGIDEAVIEKTAQGTRVSWKSELPAISIIIPTKNNLRVLKTLLDSIFSLTQYPSYEVLLVDNASDDPSTLSYYANLESDQKVRVVPFNEPFNYSKAINLGAANSKSDLLLFLNNDMQVLQSDWLKELAQWATLSEIGIVGAKLLHPNQTIQHAGVVIGLQGFMGHLYLNAPDHYYGLLGSVDWYRNVSAVTGACQILRRSVFDELGGYDENYQLVFNDVDICLRAIQKGYWILYDPFATLIHFEGHSRGYNTPIGDIVRAYEKLEVWLLHDDPYFSPNLTYTTIPKCLLKPLAGHDRINRIVARKRAILNAYRSHRA